MDISETIDSFRRGVLDLDCKLIRLIQHGPNGAQFEGPGYIRQASDGHLTFKIYVTNRTNAHPFDHLDSALQGPIGKLLSDEEFYELEAMEHGGTTWSATRIRPNPRWDIPSDSVIVSGQLLSISAFLRYPQKQSVLRLHFFEEYDVPLRLMSKTELYGEPYSVLDRNEFEACGYHFEVKVREGSGDTVFDISSNAKFPAAFAQRIQEALQYVTGKPAFWRARVEIQDDGLVVELSSQWRKSSKTQFNPPLGRHSVQFRDHGWKLFERYLAYVIEAKYETHWNPVSYHLYNAGESTANSIDAWAVGVCVAVEAVASLVQQNTDKAKADGLAAFQEKMHSLIPVDTEFADFIPRMKGLINSMTETRTTDVLHSLAKIGRVDRSYIRAWTDLRNRQVHPKIKDLDKPSAAYNQELMDKIHRAEVLLRQLTFYLIGYDGPFMDYGTIGWPVKNNPLEVQHT